jgi:hypothetical protein
MVHTPHPVTEPYSLSHLAVVSMWVIAFTTCFLCLLTPIAFSRRDQAIFRAKPVHVLYTTFSTAVTQYSSMKMEQTECCETLVFNPLNAELNPICHLLALLGGATIVDVSRLRVKLQTPGNN